ncbi:MAG: allophanate hydrolase subunit 1 [Gammaproteobacteria bacterium]|nr:allophanate hydrolase subunit 1 [Gammaproteobacteria bacterium]
MKLNLINETLIEYQFSNMISLEVSEEVLKVYQYLIENLNFQKLGLVAITPCFNSIAISFKSFSPLYKTPDFLRSEILQARNQPIKTKYKIYTIEVVYDGLDLDDVCQSLKLTQKDFIHLHKQNTYTIAMLGFRGHFPYLLGLDDKLILPRRASPRNRVDKGAVAIGSAQCGIYPESSPGGWHIIANTDFDEFDCLKAGDKIIFKEK